MASFGKIFMAVILIACGLFFFQNCKLQKNDQGDIQSVQSMPVGMDVIEYSMGLSSALDESAQHIKIDLINNKLIGHRRDLSSSDESLCKKSIDIDANLRADLLEKYDRANYCYRNVKAEPGIVCTLELKMTNNISIFKAGVSLMNDKIGIRDACYSGVVMDFCDGGEDFFLLLNELRKDMMDLCIE